MSIYSNGSESAFMSANFLNNSIMYVSNYLLVTSWDELNALLFYFCNTALQYV